jgi:hypothetical protein
MPSRVHFPLTRTTLLLAFALRAAAPAGAADLSSGPEPKSHSTALLIGATLLLAGSFTLDHPVNHWATHAQRNRVGIADGGDSFGREGSLVERLGRLESGVGLSALIYSGGLIAGSERGRRAGVTGVEATLAAGAVTLAVKSVVGRERPDGNAEEPDDFKIFHGVNFDDASFPSGHTTTSFALAAAVTEEFPSAWVQVASYGTASMVGFSRVYQNKHWVSDVVAGALIGTAVGKTVARWEQKKGWGAGLYADGRGLFLRKKFQ